VSLASVARFRQVFAVMPKTKTGSKKVANGVFSRRRPPPTTIQEAEEDSMENDEAKMYFYPPSSNVTWQKNIKKKMLLFEDHSAFYYTTSFDYKNTAKKNALLRQFGTNIELDVWGWPEVSTLNAV